MTINTQGSRIQVIDRATALLDAISRYPNPVGLKVLSAETGLHASTTHRILRSLIDNRFVDRDANGRYRLGLHLLQLSIRLHSDIDLRSIAMPYMELLRDKLNESVNLSIREGDVLVYIEKAVPNRMMHVQQLVGSRAPLHVTAVGKLMLGAGGEQEIKGYANRTNLPAYTRNTLSTYPQLLNDCNHSLEIGYAVSCGCV